VFVLSGLGAENDVWAVKRGLESGADPGERLGRSPHPKS